MKRSVAAGVLAIVLCVLAGAAQAQAAYTARTVNLRAGPGVDYPVVAVLPPGLQVWVQSCVEDYSWCDVLIGSERGWIFSGNIQSYYDDVSGYVPLYYGAWFGIAAYPFFINDYWGRYYYNRPWYPQLHRWANHHPPGHIHPPPVGRPPARPGDGTPGSPPHRPGRVPGQPHAPDGIPMQPHAPGFTPGQPHGPGAGPGQRGAPIGVPRQPSTTGVPRQPYVMGVPSGSGYHRQGAGVPVQGGGRGTAPSGGGRGAPAPNVGGGWGGGHGGRGR